MVRSQIVATGLPMDGCPPMMYDDAIRNLVCILGRAAGFKTWDEMRAHVEQNAKAL
jgi:hypothetical protein